MKIALIQINTQIGAVAQNTAKILNFIEKARSCGAELVCFPELTLVGYPPRDLLERPSLLKLCAQSLEKIKKSSKGLAVLVGSIEKNPSPKGKPLYNSAFWFENGKLRKVFRKTKLPYYDVFDEPRYFENGAGGATLTYKGEKIGVTICEDIWGDVAGRPYLMNPLQGIKNCHILINLSSSPFSQGKFLKRKKILQSLIKEYDFSTVYVNQVGGNDELIFDGGSMALNRKGQMMACAPFFQEGLTFWDSEQKKSTCSQQVSPNDWELLNQALIVGIKDYVSKCGFKKAVVGLSGGIDSALTAYLAVKALGSQNVLGVLMPSRFSSDHSLSDAKKLAQNLRVETLIVPIHSLHGEYETQFKKMFPSSPSGVAEENVQARIRGNLLMAVSNKLGHLVLTTGNKSELATGYCTLYGDMCGALAPLADMTKTKVFELCRYINSIENEIIPTSIISKPPSAELRPNQTDQDSLPPYDVLDGILEAYLERYLTETQIIKLGFDRNVVNKVIRLIHLSEYKRRQAAPALRVTERAFGIGRRYPLSSAKDAFL